ncbi:MAG: hypothetical protein K9M81_02810 [Chthoniobacterales bacterium]|nr:hypothetical protein [Chthoniobacterales bacterium]
MDAALDSHFDLDSMYTYSPASKCSSALPHQPSRPPRHDQYEISGLTRIFHTGSSRGTANPDADSTGGWETAVETAFTQP